jgi:hypothetical protein
MLDFSGTTGNATLSMDGAGIQKILGLSVSTTTGSSSILDVKLDTTHDTLTLAANSGVNYSYWDAASGGTRLSDGTTNTAVSLAGLTSGGKDIYVFDANHTTLLADLHYHV